MADSILVVLQQRDGRLHRMSREAIAAGQQLGQALDLPVEAVLLGQDLDALGAEVSGYDLAGVRLLSHPDLAVYTPGAFVDALRRLVSSLEPRFVVLPHTYQSIDFMGLLAQGVGAALLPEATAFAMEDGGIVWRRPILGGKLEARVGTKGDGPVIVSLQSGAFPADQAAAGTASAQTFDLDGNLAVDREILGTEEAGGEQIDLSQAEAIVAVGRGIGDAEKMAPALELAKALGAEVAASRPVVDNGWLPRELQIGSSGQTVTPKLYLALGISGAIQHLVGMKGSKTVVAVNRDASAPIFSVADYGYVGDLHEFIPELLAAVEETAEG